MKKLAIIAIVCLFAVPALAWEKFDGKVTDTVTVIKVPQKTEFTENHV